MLTYFYTVLAVCFYTHLFACLTPVSIAPPQPRNEGVVFFTLFPIRPPYTARDSAIRQLGR